MLTLAQGTILSQGAQAPIADPPRRQTAASAQNIYGVPTRKIYPSEDTYFKANPHVAGMAAEDNRVILNPYSKLSDGEKKAVLMNEAARVYMRTGKAPPPSFALTPEQEKAFGGYSKNAADRKATIAARILSGDPSALKPTPEQLDYVKKLRTTMGVE